jgi:hypothetical protein
MVFGKYIIENYYGFLLPHTQKKKTAPSSNRGFLFSLFVIYNVALCFADES